MKRWHSERIQDRILSKLEREEKQQAFQRDRFFKFKLPDIHGKLTQTLLMEKVIETENPGAISAEILKALKKAMRSSEFDFKYFISPIRDLVPRANPFSLYMTQYIMEVLINDPNVIEIYGTDLEIYKIVNDVITQTNAQFERTQAEVEKQLARSRSLVAGSREYEIALEQLLRQKFGEPEK